ncbi:MAG: Stp1/IreP family PP2C-type Ser/Thr phosphatase [Acidobacteria bacterium]|nr:Stp1/IreP family PP2C-type Ser/Thr phosphatase [Acidobacteriota bacterium]
MEIAFGVRSDVGLVRTNNEDHFAVDPDLNLFILCDGMGGQAAGEVASRMGAELILEHCRQTGPDPRKALEGPYHEEFSAQTNRLLSGIRVSNKAIFDAAGESSSGTNGMGSTVVAVQISGNVMSVAHVGDSRVYLFRNGQLRQLTEDHSLVREQVRQGLITAEEAEQSELANVILRALGAEPTVVADLDEVWVGAKDQILLCSDGLTRMVPDAEIATVLTTAQTPQEAADRLVELANEHGGEDNTTVLVARLLPSATRWKRWLRIFGGGDRAWPN